MERPPPPHEQKKSAPLTAWQKQSGPLVPWQKQSERQPWVRPQPQPDEEEEEPREQPQHEGLRLLAAARRAREEEQRRAWELAASLEPRAPRQDPAQTKEEAGREERVPDLAAWEGGEGHLQRLVSMRNYAAVDAEQGDYGLIDRGVRQTGVRALVMHGRKRARDRRRDPLAGVRPGTILQVFSSVNGCGGKLRVRYTTPARYYSPGQRVSTMGIGVDERDWRLMTEARAGGDIGTGMTKPASGRRGI
jgi:hypothetical protein